MCEISNQFLNELIDFKELFYHELQKIFIL